MIFSCGSRLCNNTTCVCPRATLPVSEPSFLLRIFSDMRKTFRRSRAMVDKWEAGKAPDCWPGGRSGWDTAGGREGGPPGQEPTQAGNQSRTPPLPTVTHATGKRLGHTARLLLAERQPSASSDRTSAAAA